MPKNNEIGVGANNSSLNTASTHETSTILERGVLKPTPEKYCAYCGTKMERTRYKSKLEDLGAFKRRKYCSWECMRKSFVTKDSTNQSWKSAHATARKLIHLIEQREVVCAKCGSTSNVDIHHIDGIAQNNNPENLMLLCRSCHMKAHRTKIKCCSVCGVECKRTQRGMCNKHYIQWRRNGNPLHKPWSTYKEKASKGPIYVFDKQGNLIKTYADVRHKGNADAYSAWVGMLTRCYNEKALQRAPTYHGCSVCDEWLTFSNFRKWFYAPENGYKQGLHLDKDLIQIGNKIYSPDTCCFLPVAINSVVTNKYLASNKTRVRKFYNKFYPVIKMRDKLVSLGSFYTKEEADNAYKRAKESYIYMLADEYYKKGDITKRVYDAMLNFKMG